MQESAPDYEYNRLPEDSEHEQKRKTDFSSPEEKLAYDAAGLIALAKERYKKDIVTVTEVLDLRSRKDDDSEALRQAIAIQIKNGDSQEAEPENISTSDTNDTEVPTDIEAITAHLERIYSKTPNPPTIPKNAPTWQAIAQKFLKDPSALEDLNDMVEPVIYLFDEDGYPELADGIADVTEMTKFMGEDGKGLIYEEARYLVLFKEDKEGNEVPTLHELFPYQGDYEKSLEIEAFEKVTSRPFVYPKEGERYCSSWLESGDNPSSPGVCVRRRDRRRAYVSYNSPVNHAPRVGVRRRLRVSKLFDI